MPEVYIPRKKGNPSSKRRRVIQSSLNSEDKRDWEAWMARHRINCTEALRWLTSLAVANDWDPWEKE